jgi:hypothetical protein
MTVGYKKEGSGAAFWIVAIFLAIAIAFGVWFFLKREEKPARANPSQSRMFAPTASAEWAWGEAVSAG